MQRSPNTKRAHCIPHQWVEKRCTNPTKKKCAVCANLVGFLSGYEKCKSCKQSVHHECKIRVTDNCGLTPKHFKEILTQLVITARQDKWAAPSIGASKSMNDMRTMTVIELPTTSIAADSSSSANSSAPTTPAAAAVAAANGYASNVSAAASDRLIPHTANICVSNSSQAQFSFPDSGLIPHIVLPSSSNDEQSAVVNSQGSDVTLRPYVNDDGGDRNGSTADLNEQGTNGEPSHKWDRRSWNIFTVRAHGTNATSWRELTISSDQIRVNALIGRGRFGEVYEVDHFGTVAIKLLNMNHVDEDKRVEAFKQDTTCFQNTRHDNLVFFVGYTMDRDRLGIIMEYIKGQPLFQLLHDDDFVDKRLDFNDILDFAQQICQGMSYLHTKRIFHKDLRSKNIFIKERRVVITDYGIFNVKKLSYPARTYTFLIPDHWLCYLAPELMRSLTPNLDPIPFSDKTDIFAFGTIWFELLTRRFPFDFLPSDSVIWQIGSGMKTALGNINACKEAKMLLMSCWTFEAADRSSFVEALRFLEAMPKKPLRRSPSFPACKSFESIF